MMTTKAFPDHDLAMLRVVPIRQAAELAGVSEDTLRRRRPDKIIQLSPRRQGMRVRDALMLP
jgi:hypothetical protein